MRSRRDFVLKLFTLSTLSTVGCLGSEEKTSDQGSTNKEKKDSETKLYELGQGVRFAGVRMGVSEYTTISSYKVGDNSEKITPSSGAVFLLVGIKMKNVGNNERILPDRKEDIKLIYNGEEANDEFPTANKIVSDNKQYKLLSAVREKKGGDAGVSPGTEVSGWAMFEVPENFVQSATVVTIRHDFTNTKVQSKHKSKTIRWKLG